MVAIDRDGEGDGPVQKATLNKVRARRNNPQIAAPYARWVRNDVCGMVSVKRRSLDLEQAFVVLRAALSIHSSSSSLSWVMPEEPDSRSESRSFDGGLSRDEACCTLDMSDICSQSSLVIA